LHIQGKRNFFFLAGVIVAAVSSGYFGWPRGIQEFLMISMALLSWFSTPKKVHEENHFNFHPILEVAAVFVGIFITMIPALEILRMRSADLGIQKPWQYFWMSGALSSFLDNAPTYLTFSSMALGLVGTGTESLGALIRSDLGVSLLRAVSAGSVFMGANSYIGNGPNFMVKSIAEHHRIEMPSFGRYMLYSGVVLIPTFVLVHVVFFR
jgi:Na+/H+ antiporter NhaD/arsenite permease-like protein